MYIIPAPCIPNTTHNVRRKTDAVGVPYTLYNARASRAYGESKDGARQDGARQDGARQDEAVSAQTAALDRWMDGWMDEWIERQK